MGDARRAALDAGFVRLRPVLMTALAMIIGMVPMALGLGDGGEQNAPLGRAVIGGLFVATVATLLFVPVVFSIAHAKRAHEPNFEPDTGSQRRTRLAKATPGREVLHHRPDAVAEAGRAGRGRAVAVVVGAGLTDPPTHWPSQSLKSWTDAQAIPTVKRGAAGRRESAATRR